MPTYFYYQCQGYLRYDKEQDLFLHASNVSVIATNEEEALKKASTLLKKENWRVVSIEEHYCPKE